MSFVAGQRVTAAELNATTMTLFNSTVLNASVNTVTISNIPQTLTNLRWVINAKSDGTTVAGYDPCTLRFNGISTANYCWSTYFLTQGAGAMSFGGSTGSTGGQVANIWNSHFASAGRASVVIDIPNYSDVNNLKTYISSYGASDGGTVSIMGSYHGSLGNANTAAVTSLTISMNLSTNFIADSTFTLYGY